MQVVYFNLEDCQQYAPSTTSAQTAKELEEVNDAKIFTSLPYHDVNIASFRCSTRKHAGRYGSGRLVAASQT